MQSTAGGFAFDKFCPQGCLWISILSAVVALGYLLGKLETVAEGSQNRNWSTAHSDSKSGHMISWLCYLGVDCLTWMSFRDFKFLLRG